MVFVRDVFIPLSYSIYTEKIFREAVEQKTEGIIANGLLIDNMSYANDATLLATSIEDSPEQVNSVVTAP